jgi:ribosomal protein L18E
MLVDIGAACAWAPDDVLSHVAACEGCRLQLRRLARFHGAATGEAVPSSSFADRVVATALRPPRRARKSAPLWRAVNSVLAGATVLVGAPLLGAAPSPAWTAALASLAAVAHGVLAGLHPQPGS